MYGIATRLGHNSLFGAIPVRKWLILKRRDAGAVDQARLEIDSGRAHQRTPKRTNALSINDFPQKHCAAVWPRNSQR